MSKAVYFGIIVLLLMIASHTDAKSLDLTFYLGLRDGSQASDGVTVRWFVEGKKPELIFEQHWREQKWSDEFRVSLLRWAGELTVLNMTTDPGPARNIGWDWILIAEPKIVSDGKIVYDFFQAVVEGRVKLSVLLDGDKAETPGLHFGANCSPAEAGPVGGVTKSKVYMQHPPWNGRVGNTIARFEVQLPASCELLGKKTTLWGDLKTR